MSQESLTYNIGKEKEPGGKMNDMVKSTQKIRERAPIYMRICEYRVHSSESTSNRQRTCKRNRKTQSALLTFPLPICLLVPKQVLYRHPGTLLYMGLPPGDIDSDQVLQM